MKMTVPTIAPIACTERYKTGVPKWAILPCLPHSKITIDALAKAKFQLSSSSRKALEMPKLFAVYLGGNAAGSNIELHDVQFVVGETIEDTYNDLLNLWFGIPDGLHLDSYMPLEVVDGHRVNLSFTKKTNENSLFFVNLGAYRPSVFGEDHANKFIVANDTATVKRRARSELMQDWGSPVHTDDLFELDECVEVIAKGWNIHLEPTQEPQNLHPVNGYHIIPKSFIAAFKAKISQSL